LSLLGHFGFLSEAYTQDSAVQTVTKDKAELMDKTISRYEQELADIQNLIDRTPDNFVTRRQQLYSNTADRRQELNRLIDSLYTARNSISKEEYVVDLQIGPFKHLAKLLSISQDSIARAISFWLAAIIDPLAILLIMVGVQESGKKSPSRSSSKEVVKSRRWDIKRRKRNHNPDDKTYVTAGDFDGDIDTSIWTGENNIIVVNIGGKYRDAIFKLAAILSIKNKMVINLNDSTKCIEDICVLLPNVVSTTINSDQALFDLDLKPAPPRSDWIVNYYTKLVGAEPFDNDEWFGYLSHLLPDSTAKKDSIYINLEDAELERYLQTAILGLYPNCTIYFESLTKKSTAAVGDTLDIIRRASAYQHRIVSLGHLSSAFELFGLTHTAYQNGISDKIVTAYKFPAVDIIPPYESKLLQTIALFGRRSGV